MLLQETYLFLNSHAQVHKSAASFSLVQRVGALCGKLINATTRMRSMYETGARDLFPIPPRVFYL